MALQQEDHDDAAGAMDQAVVFGLALSLPAAVALMAMPGYLVEGFFRGAPSRSPTPFLGLAAPSTTAGS